jgi:hypothetical protein
MKKTIITLTTGILFMYVAYAQNTRIGFTAGAAFANYKAKVDGESDQAKSKTGITAGILVDIPLSEHFSFQPAVNFVQKGTKDEETFGGVTEKIQLTVNSIEVPLNFLYNAPGNTGNFFIGAGPSLAFAISGKWKFEDGTNSLTEDVEFGNDENEDDMKGLDLGANFITGYRFPNGLLLSVNYNMGLSNLVPGGSDDGTLKSSYFGIKLGWLLNGKGKK